MTDKVKIDLLVEALIGSKREHRYCEDDWYSCPKHPDGCLNPSEGTECNCGAEKWNNHIDEVLKEVGYITSPSWSRSTDIKGKI
jgi:hypothetical protein